MCNILNNSLLFKVDGFSGAQSEELNKLAHGCDSWLPLCCPEQGYVNTTEALRSLAVRSKVLKSPNTRTKQAKINELNGEPRFIYNLYDLSLEGANMSAPIRSSKHVYLRMKSTWRCADTHNPILKRPRSWPRLIQRTWSHLWQFDGRRNALESSLLRNFYANIRWTSIMVASGKRKTDEGLESMSRGDSSFFICVLSDKSKLQLTM